MRNRKGQITEGIELPNQEKKNSTFGEKEIYKYLGILEVDTIKEAEMKEKKKKVSNTNEKASRKQTLSQESHQTDEYLGCSLFKITGTILKIDQRTRKLMTMHKILHQRDDIDRFYVSRKEGGSGLTSVEDSTDTTRRLHKKVKKE